jgi:hypothetical protein
LGGANHGDADDHEDDAGDHGGNKGADGGDDLLGATAHAGAYDNRHEHGGHALGGKVNKGRGGGDLNHGRGDEANDQRLRDVGANDQDGEAERRDDELGANHAAGDAGDCLPHGEVEDEAGGEKHGKKHQRANVELSMILGGDGAGLLRVGVLGHGWFLSNWMTLCVG